MILFMCSQLKENVFRHVVCIGGGFAVILIAFFEILAVFWVYGMKRLMNNVLFMMNYTPSMYFRCCWLFISPLVLVVSEKN